MVISDYLSCVITPEQLEETISTCVERLRPYADEFDAIAFRGMSGTLVAPAVCIFLKKHMMMVRKPRHNDNHHSSDKVEGKLGVSRYIILDDFISSGETLRAIIQRVGDAHIEQGLTIPECVGGIMYKWAENGYAKEVIHTYLNRVMNPGGMSMKSFPVALGGRP